MVELFFKPKNKPRVFSKGWSIELITNLKPLFSEGYHHYIINIDFYSKWTKLQPI